MKYTLIIIVALLIQIALAKAAPSIAEVTEVRRNITLHDDDKPVKDFYLKIADGSSLKKNMIVRAVRRLEAKDLGQKKMGDFTSVVALLKVIQVEGKVAIAREHKSVAREEQPMLEQVGVMMGDEIEVVENAGASTKSAQLVRTDGKKFTDLKKKNSPPVAAKTAPTKDRQPASVEAPPRAVEIKGTPVLGAPTAQNALCPCPKSTAEVSTPVEKK